jgi:hypothetical protein
MSYDNNIGLVGPRKDNRMQQRVILKGQNIIPKIEFFKVGDIHV